MSLPQLVALFAVLMPAIVTAPVAADEKPAPVPLVEVARVNGVPIYLGEIEQELTKIAGSQHLAGADRARLLAHFLDQWIDRRLVLNFLEKKKQTTSKQLVDAEIDALRSRLEQRKTSLKQYLLDHGFTEKSLRTDLMWRMSWKRYVDQNVTEKVLQRIFAKDPRQYDGTQLRVRHILLQAKDADSASIARAEAIRAEIVDGKLQFEDAVAKYSTGPSKAAGGDLGFITRRGQMVEPFSAAAFALDEMEISQPVVTQFGVHLIQCVEVKPGEKKWNDVAEQLRSAAVQTAFRRIADGQRPKAKIEFSGASPYFDPNSRKLISPAK